MDRNFFLDAHDPPQFLMLGQALNLYHDCLLHLLDTMRPTSGRMTFSIWMCWVRSCFEGEKEKQREIIVEKVSQCLVQGEILEGDDYRMIEQGERTEER